MSATTRAWLFVRGRDSVRIVIDGTEVTVYGPSGRFSHSRFGEELDATLHQAAVEQTLVLDGWTLEQMTTERRADLAQEAHSTEERRRAFRLVPPVRHTGS